MSEDMPRTFDNLVASEMPNGQCGHCGMGLMTMDGVKKCPNCSTRTVGTSNIVNNASDPGDAKLKAALAQPMPVKPDYKDIQTVEIPVSQLKQLRMPERGYQTQLEDVYSYLGTINVDNVAKFKQLLKLKKETLDLKNKIQLFIDSK